MDEQWHCVTCMNPTEMQTILYKLCIVRGDKIVGTNLLDDTTVGDPVCGPLRILNTVISLLKLTLTLTHSHSLTLSLSRFRYLFFIRFPLSLSPFRSFYLFPLSLTLSLSPFRYLFFICLPPSPAFRYLFFICLLPPPLLSLSLSLLFLLLFDTLYFILHLLRSVYCDHAGVPLWKVLVEWIDSRICPL